MEFEALLILVLGLGISKKTKQKFAKCGCLVACVIFFGYCNKQKKPPAKSMPGACLRAWGLFFRLFPVRPIPIDIQPGQFARYPALLFTLSTLDLAAANPQGLGLAVSHCYNLLP